mgnify:CR=1 FL=1
MSTLNEIKSVYNFLIKNFNSYTENSNKYKNKEDYEVFGAMLFKTSYPMKNKSEKFNNFPILIGTSKKSFLGEISNNKDIDSRTEISIASALDLKNKGANIFRMHDAILFKKIISYLDLLK